MMTIKFPVRSEFHRLGPVNAAYVVDAEGAALTVEEIIDALNATTTAPDLTATLERIVALVNEWEANGLGGVAVQRKRWQKLGEIARAALTKDGTP